MIVAVAVTVIVAMSCLPRTPVLIVIAQAFYCQCGMAFSCGYRGSLMVREPHHERVGALATGGFESLTTSGLGRWPRADLGAGILARSP